jgi:RES domain-containing protein
MRVWRLCQERFASAAFTGDGARLYGGRWHRAGMPAIYTSSTLSLAALDVLVHFDHELAPARFVAFPVSIPTAVRLQRLSAKQLPRNWRALPAPDETQDLGSKWLKSRKSVGLIVPSALVPQERNVLLDPTHPDFARLRIGTPEPFSFDPRLVRASA